MNPELDELYQEVILDHSRHPRSFGRLADAAVRIHGDNPACGDEIDLDVKFGPDGSVQEIKFSGHGCAISQASASMMTAKLKGKPRAAAMETLRAFSQLVAGPEGHKLPPRRCRCRQRVQRVARYRAPAKALPRSRTHGCCLTQDHRR